MLLVATVVEHVITGGVAVLAVQVVVPPAEAAAAL
jgi:hypothetical protein